LPGKLPVGNTQPATKKPKAPQMGQETKKQITKTMWGETPGGASPPFLFSGGESNERN